MKKNVDSYFHVSFNKASNGNVDAREEYVFMQLLKFTTFVYYSYTGWLHTLVGQVARQV